MKVVVATTAMPFVQGGATLIVDWLCAALRQRGHEVEVFSLPFATDPTTMPTQMVGLRALDFTDRCDRLITVRTPSYLVRHPRKSVWFLHHHRPAYDLWDLARDVEDDADGWEFRRMMFASDETALAESAVFCNSEVMRRRLREYSGVEAEVLFPPLDPEGGYVAEDVDDADRDTIVYVSRVIDHKRQLLTVEALARTTTPVRLALVGAFDHPDSDYVRRIRAAIQEHGLEDRVDLTGTWAEENAKRTAIARSLAAVYLPVDEDSYGYPSLEAAVLGRPVVTTTDSGGVLELVQDEVNGLVVDPEPAALAAAFDRLWEDRTMAERLGRAQAGRLESLQISWDHVIERLLA